MLLLMLMFFVAVFSFAEDFVFLFRGNVLLLLLLLMVLLLCYSCFLVRKKLFPLFVAIAFCVFRVELSCLLYTSPSPRD